MRFMITGDVVCGAFTAWVEAASYEDAKAIADDRIAGSNFNDMTDQYPEIELSVSSDHEAFMVFNIEEDPE